MFYGIFGTPCKSDLDNYERLPKQIEAYNQFFDKNYLVVSEKYRVSASDNIPRDWGIICISNDGVEIVREPLLIYKYSRRKQLSILWKLELKNWID